jgi:hypothetical protein
VRSFAAKTVVEFCLEKMSLALNLTFSPRRRNRYPVFFFSGNASGQSHREFLKKLGALKTLLPGSKNLCASASLRLCVKT